MAISYNLLYDNSLSYFKEESDMEKISVQADRDRVKSYMYDGENYNEKFLNKTVNSEFKKAVSNIKDGEQKKDPNILVKVLKKLRSFYQKFFRKYNSLYTEYKHIKSDAKHDTAYKKLPIYKRFLFRLSKMIDKVLFKLQSLVDRRTYEQLSKDEKIDKANDYITHDKKLAYDFGIGDAQEIDIKNKFKNKEEANNVININKYINNVNDLNKFKVQNKQSKYGEYLHRKRQHNNDMIEKRLEKNRKNSFNVDGVEIETDYSRTPMKNIN